MTINIDELTLGQIKQLKGLVGDSNSNEPHVYTIGKNYLIRTVTQIQIGRLVKVTDKELVLQNACWVADTGRFSECLSNGSIDEIEMFPAECEVIVGRGALVDACEWLHDLPTETK